MTRPLDVTPDLFGPPEREVDLIDEAARLHRQMACERPWQRKRAIHAAAMELIYKRLGPKPDGTLPRAKR